LGRARLFPSNGPKQVLAAL